MVNRQAKH